MEAASPPQPSTSLPPFTRTLTLLLIILAIFSHIPPFATPLTATVSLIPASTIARSKPWNILSAGFVELDVARAFLNVPLLLVLARCIEASWGPRMMAVYILAVNFLAGFIAYISMLVAYAATHIDSFLYVSLSTFP